MENKHIINHFLLIAILVIGTALLSNAQMDSDSSIVPVNAPINGSSGAADQIDTLAPPTSANTGQLIDNKKDTLRFYRLDITEGIFAPAWRKAKRALEEADALGVDYIVLRLNTYGGQADLADSIRSKFLKAKATTVVWVDNNAASAGALISIACDSIYMVSAAQMGAATGVTATGEQAPDKFQSYFRATMRSTAETQGRDPRIAEAMVDDRIAIPGIIDSAKTLTFTTSEAIKHGYCDGSFENFTDVIDHLAQGYDHIDIIEYQETSLDKLIAFLLSPTVVGVLMLFMFLGIYVEFQTPGIGIPLLVSIVAAVIFFAPNYLEGMAENWEIMLFFMGLLFIALEIFVIPGFGVAGLLGITGILVGLSFSMLHNDFFDFSAIGGVEVAFQAILQVLISLFGAILVMILLGGRFIQSNAFKKRISLETTQDASAGYTIKNDSYLDLVGKIGVAVTDLRISGRVEVDGEIYDAITIGTYIEAGKKIEVKKYQLSSLVVQEVKDDDDLVL